MRKAWTLVDLDSKFISAVSQGLNNFICGTGRIWFIRLVTGLNINKIICR